MKERERERGGELTFYRGAKVVGYGIRSSKRHDRRDQENNAQLFSNKTTVQRVFEEKLNERMSVRISKDKMKKATI